MSTPSDLLSVAQAARVLNIGRRAVVHRIHAGTLPAIKLGNGPTNAYVIQRSDVEAARDEAAREEAS